MGTLRPNGFFYLDKINGYFIQKHEGRWMPQHRVFMSQKLGRPLLKSEVVHHINEIRSDNRLENLELMDASKHKSLHHTGVKRSEETKKRQSESAIRVANRDGERHRRSVRAKKQHREGRFGY